MQSVIPPGDPARTVIAGRDQGFRGLAINYGQLEEGNNIYPTMTTAWQPDAEELALLNAGASVIIRLLGRPPITPMSVFVGDPPD